VISLKQNAQHLANAIVHLRHQFFIGHRVMDRLRQALFVLSTMITAAAGKGYRGK
jgi:hypothetical protein